MGRDRESENEYFKAMWTNKLIRPEATDIWIKFFLEKPKNRWFRWEEGVAGELMLVVQEVLDEG